MIRAQRSVDASIDRRTVGDKDFTWSERSKNSSMSLLVDGRTILCAGRNLCQSAPRANSATAR